MYQIFLNQIRENRLDVFRHLVIIFVLWCFDIATPYLFGLYIDYIVSDIQWDIFAILIVSITVINLTQLVLRYFQSTIVTRLTKTITYNISNKVFQKLFSLEETNIFQSDSSYYIDQINNDSHVVARFFTSNIINFVTQFSTVAICIIVILRVDTILGFVATLFVPCYMLSFALSKKKLYNVKLLSKDSANKYFSIYSEQITKILHIKRNSLGAEMEARLNHSFKQMLNSLLKCVRVEYIFTNFNQILISVTYLSIISIGGYKVSSGILTIGYFSTINTYLNMIMRSTANLHTLIGAYQDATVSANRIGNILNSEEPPHNTKIISDIHTIDIANLCVHYNRQPVLTHFNYHFKKGTLYGIQGQNGCGKTTLLNAIIGLYTGEHTGQIKYNNIPITQLDMYTIRKNSISFLEQNPVTFNMPVKDYLTFGLNPNSCIQEQQRMSKYWGVENLLSKNIQENGGNLSGGERQKLAMIKLLGKRSSLFLLDEPTSALDRQSTKKLIDVLTILKETSIVIVVSHDTDILSKCDTLIKL